MKLKYFYKVLMLVLISSGIIVFTTHALKTWLERDLEVFDAFVEEAPGKLDEITTKIKKAIKKINGASKNDAKAIATALDNLNSNLEKIKKPIADSSFNMKAYSSIGNIVASKMPAVIKKLIEALRNQDNKDNIIFPQMNKDPFYVHKNLETLITILETPMKIFTTDPGSFLRSSGIANMLKSLSKEIEFAKTKEEIEEERKKKEEEERQKEEMIRKKEEEKLLSQIQEEKERERKKKQLEKERQERLRKQKEEQKKKEEIERKRQEEKKESKRKEEAEREKKRERLQKKEEEHRRKQKEELKKKKASERKKREEEEKKRKEQEEKERKRLRKIKDERSRKEKLEREKREKLKRKKRKEQERLRKKEEAERKRKNDERREKEAEREKKVNARKELVETRKTTLEDTIKQSTGDLEGKLKKIETTIDTVGRMKKQIEGILSKDVKSKEEAEEETDTYEKIIKTLTKTIPDSIRIAPVA